MEEPLYEWILAGELGIMQDGAFAIDRRGSKLRMTLARSNIYGYDMGWTVDQNAPTNHTDLGEHEFKLRFVKRQGLRDSDLDSILNAFIEPFKVVRDSRVLSSPIISANNKSAAHPAYAYNGAK